MGLNFKRAEQIAYRMSLSTTGQESVEWLLAALLLKWITSPSQRPSNGVTKPLEQPKKVEMTNDR